MFTRPGDYDQMKATSEHVNRFSRMGKLEVIMESVTDFSATGLADRGA